MFNAAVADASRAAHDLGLAGWLGGTAFGRFALNPAVRRISDPAERGAVVTAAWNGYNVVNALSLGAVAAGWVGARLTDSRPAKLSAREQAIARVKDVVVAGAVATGVVNAIQAGRLAAQAEGGAVPVETGSLPAPETPPEAAAIQRSLAVLGTANLAAGVVIGVLNALLAQEAHSRPPARRSPLGRGLGLT